jgi:hypothetical protein
MKVPFETIARTAEDKGFKVSDFIAKEAIPIAIIDPLSSAVLAIVSKGTFINIAKINEIKLNTRLSPKSVAIGPFLGLLLMQQYSIEVIFGLNLVLSFISLIKHDNGNWNGFFRDKI